MTYQLTRDATGFDPRKGLLSAEHFQMAYATTDMAEAKRLFADRLGIRAFIDLEGPMPSGGTMHAAFAWVGTLMYEIIESRGPGSALYMERLPDDGGFHVRHHHLGFLARDRTAMDGVLAQAERHGWPVLGHATNPYVEFCFVEVPALGHYLEYLLPTEAGMDFFRTIPRS